MITFAGKPHQLAVDAARLAADIERIAGGVAPTEPDLEAAPLLDGWRPGVVWHEVLLGTVVDHPRLGTKPTITTSQLFCLDLERGWARTWSRFYRLGASHSECATGGHG